MIIGLCGLKGSGKDTIAAYLVKQHGFERKAFADPIKRSIAALFNIPFHEIDRLKNDPTYLVQTGNNLNLEGYELYDKTMTFREFLQRYGTEAHRDVFNDDFWVDVTLPVQGFYPGRAIVVTDVRFRNEAERVKTLGGMNICIIRDDAALGIKDQHRSEIIDFDRLVDFTIENNSSLEELYNQMEDILAKAPLESVC